jgi:hypothetical protein
MSDAAPATFEYFIHEHGRWYRSDDLEDAKKTATVCILDSRDPDGDWLDGTSDICIARMPTSCAGTDFLFQAEVFMQAVERDHWEDGVLYGMYDIVDVTPRKLR